ncbi:MAG: hypothetical protein KKB56_17595 [Gammaproteobacteria bacterium]|nr:hypothetical protein [Alphaproteobacteria bacterium]MBU1774995.1 hypothetical protein [Gammaproteobacteria bacterium]
MKAVMYSSTEGVEGEVMYHCDVVVRDQMVVIEYRDEYGTVTTYQAQEKTTGAYQIDLESEGDDYFYRATLNLVEPDYYEGCWSQRYGNEYKKGQWSIEITEGRT